MKIAEFFGDIGFNIDKKPLENTEKLLLGLNSRTVALGAAAAVTGAALFNMQNAVTRNAANLKAFNVQTGLSVQKLQELQVAARLSDINVSSQQITQSVQQLQEQLTNLQKLAGLPGPMAKAAEFLNLGLQRDAFGVIEGLRQSIEKFGPTLTTKLVKNLGIDPSFVAMLKEADARVQNIASRLATPEEEVKKINDLGKQIELRILTFERLQDKLVAGLAPAIIGTLNLLERLGVVLVKLSRDAMQASRSLFGIDSGLHIIAGTLLFVMIPALRKLAVATLLNPFILKLSALLLIIEDIYSFIEGKNSFIGEVLKEGDVLVTKVTDKLSQLWQAYSAIIASIKSSILGIQNDFISVFDAIADYFVSAFQKALKEITETDVFQHLSKMLKYLGAIEGGPKVGNIQTDGGTSEEATRSLANMITGGNPFNAMRFNAQDFLGPLGMPLSDMMPAQTNTFNNTFYIQGDNAQAIANETSLSIQEQMNRAQLDFNNSGVR